MNEKEKFINAWNCVLKNLLKFQMSPKHLKAFWKSLLKFCWNIENHDKVKRYNLLYNHKDYNIYAFKH